MANTGRKRGKDLYRKVRRVDRERETRKMSRLEWRAARRGALRRIGAMIAAGGGR